MAEITVILGAVGLFVAGFISWYTLWHRRATAAFERVLGRFSLKLGQLAQPVRVALTGGTVSPGIYEVIAVLGRERTVVRLRAAIEVAKTNA